jgi:tetratricopeptide (TPR) repeat protein
VTLARWLAGLLTCSALASACALRFAPPPGRTEPPLRLHELADSGDAARRASVRIVLNGLEADVAREPDRALGTYEEALRVDPTNPYAYLALARHHAEGEDPEWALSFLDKADALLRAEGGRSPRVEPHLIGLRGQALCEGGRVEEGLPYLEQALDLAPGVWSDGRLTADELR